MATRKPLVVVSGFISELPPNDGIEGAAGVLTAGSGLLGGGSLTTNQRIDVGLASNPSGLILVGNNLGLDGVAQRTADTALASGNAALSSAATAQASGNAALVSAATAQASGNAALSSAATALASGNAALSSAATALASGNAALTSASLKLPLTGGILTGDLTLDNQSDLRFREATAGGTNYVGFQAPATVGSDVLWTLPGSDGTSGQVLQTNGTGTLSFATPAGGKVLQVVTFEWTGTSSTSSSSFQQSGLTTTITPSSSSSRILITAACNVATYSIGGTILTLYRNDTTNLSSVLNFADLRNSVNGNYLASLLTFSYLDSPATTSSTRYRVYFLSTSGNTMYLNLAQYYGNISSTITLMEIGA